MNLNTSTALNVSVMCSLFPLVLSTARAILWRADFSTDDTDSQQFVLSRIRMEATEDGYAFSVNVGEVFAHVCLIEVN